MSYVLGHLSHLCDSTCQAGVACFGLYLISVTSLQVSTENMVYPHIRLAFSVLILVENHMQLVLINGNSSNEGMVQIQYPMKGAVSDSYFDDPSC